MRAAVVGVVAAIVFVGAGRVAQSGDDADRGHRVEEIARDLEAPDAAKRAKAAAELGTMFPEGAVAVPVLMDAADDDDAAVRTAAVASLRRLGRAGLEVVARQAGSLPREATTTIISVASVLAALGEAVTPTDLAFGLASAAEDGPDAVRGMVLLLAARSPRSWSDTGQSSGPDPAFLDLVAPWTSSSDAALAEAASATLAIWGRALVARAPWDSKTEADLASPDTIVPLLSESRPSRRWLGWGLTTNAAPHSDKTVAAMLAQWEAVKGSGADSSGDSFEGSLTEKNFNRARAARLVEALGARAGDALRDALNPIRAWEALGRAEEARRAWTAATAGSIDPKGAGVSPDLIGIALEVDAVAAVAARDLLPWFREAVKSSEAEALRRASDSINPIPNSQPPRAVETIVATASLLEAAPDDVVPSDVRASALAILSGALLAPRATGAPLRAAGYLNVNRSQHRALADMLASVVMEPRARPTDFDPRLNVSLLERLARFDRVPAPATSALVRALRAPAPPTEMSLRERLRNAKGWPQVRAAIAIKELGFQYSSDRRMRLAAIDALGKIDGDPSKAKAALESLTKDDDARVRYRTARALRRLAAAK